MNIIKKIIKVCCMVLMSVLLLCSCGPKNGLVNENSKTYYYVNGERQYGWQKINEDYYYFGTGADVPEDQIGAMCKNYLIGESEEKIYGLGNDGKMLKNQFATIDNRRLYFGADGTMLTNTQKEINGKIYVFDNVGNAEALPDYQLVFNCTFPKMFREGRYSWSDVTIENINYKVKYDDGEAVFETYWSGTAGNTYKGKNHSRRRCVGWKLYDPNNYVINSGVFGTEVDLKTGEKFKDTREDLYWLDRGVLKEKGIYRLELMDCE